MFILDHSIKGKENITISNNQIIKKIDNSEALENQYIKKIRCASHGGRLRIGVNNFFDPVRFF